MTPAILTLKKIYKTHRHSGAVPRRDRHPGSYHSDSAPAPGGDSYPESPATKSQTGNFMDTVHSLKEGDSGPRAVPRRDAAHLRRRAPGATLCKCPE